MGHIYSRIWDGFSYTPSIYYGSTSSTLHTRSSFDYDESELSTLKQFIETYCPSLLQGFRPAWWLNSGHLQTVYCVLGDFSKIDRILYDRKMLRLKDGGTLGLDFTPPVSERTVHEDSPIVVVMHGLTGGSHESYVRCILVPAITPVEEGGLGYRGVVVNFRGCAGVPLTSGQLYSAGHTDDLRQALMYIKKTYPNAPLLGLGFSLGANVVVRYLGEEGHNSLLRTGCVLACSSVLKPWDLMENSNRLEGSWFHRVTYSRAMGENLQKLAKKHVDPFTKFSDDRRRLPMDELLSLKSPTLYDVDCRLTSIVGGSMPPFPFPSAHAYYMWASSHESLKDIRVPLLAVNAADDPIVHTLPLDAGENGLVALAATKSGGHLGWFESADNSTTCTRVKRWISRPAIEWLRASVANLVDTKTRNLVFEEEGGFITQVGLKDLGYRYIGDAGEIKGIEGEGGISQGL